MKIRIHIKERYETPGITSSIRELLKQNQIYKVIVSAEPDDKPDRYYIDDLNPIINGYYFLKSECTIVRKPIVIVE